MTCSPSSLANEVVSLRLILSPSFFREPSMVAVTETLKLPVAALLRLTLLRDTLMGSNTLSRLNCARAESALVPARYFLLTPARNALAVLSECLLLAAADLADLSLNSASLRV